MKRRLSHVNLVLHEVLNFVEDVDYLDNTGADNLNEADTLGHVTNGPGYIKTPEVTGS